MEPTPEKKYSKLEWIFYIIILPLLFISILTAVLLWFLGYDVKATTLETLNRVPYVEKLIDDEQFLSEEEQKIDPLQEKVIQLTSLLNENNKEISEYKGLIQTKEEEITKLQSRMEDLITAKVETKKTIEENIAKKTDELSKLYSNMSPKSAANILSNLNEDDALSILNRMSIDTRGQIMEKMDPQKAASLTVQEKINALKKELAHEQQVSELVQVFREMENDTLAKVLSTMDTEKAGVMLKQLSTEKKSNVLQAMDSNKATELSLQLESLAYTNEEKIASLVENIEALKNEQKIKDEKKLSEADYQGLASTYANMKPDIAAKTIMSIALQDSKKANNILAAMNPVSRSNILNEIEPEQAARLSIELVD